MFIAASSGDSMLSRAIAPYGRARASIIARTRQQPFWHDRVTMVSDDPAYTTLISSVKRQTEGNRQGSCEGAGLSVQIRRTSHRLLPPLP